jgi:hypothetical protein
MFFLLLLFISGGLYVKVLLEAYRVSLWLGFFISFFVVGFVYQFQKEVKAYKEKEGNFKGFQKEDFLLMGWVLVSTYFTFIVINYLGVGPVFVSGTLGVFASLFLKKFMMPIFCGSFVGMVSEEIVNHPAEVFLAGSVAGLLFVLYKRGFQDVGGKLGTIAFGGGIFMIFSTGQSFSSEEFPSNKVTFIILLCTIVGALLTYLLQHRIKLSPVLASGLVGVMGGLFFQILYPDLAGNLTTALYCSTFVGMSSQKRFRKESPIILVGLMVGVFFILSFPHFGGVGGKIGTVAFVSLLSLEGGRNLLEDLVKILK